MPDAALLKYGKYITSLISSVILNTAPPVPFSGIDWEVLYHLAKKHSVAIIIYPAIKSLNLPEDISKLFEADKNRIVSRTTRQSIESDRVLNIFEENDIKYIKLKGIHIKEFYPAPYMRTFSDIDLCLSEDGREKAKPIMKELGYKLENVLDFHDEYEKDNFYIYELHHPIVSDELFYSDIFSDPFSKAHAVSDSNLSFVLNNEYFYLHLFFHLHRHFVTRGCGIRLFVDLLVFQQNIKDVDYDFIKSVLDKYDMTDFYDSVQKLIDYFFFDKTADKNTLTIAEFILKNRFNEEFNKRFANLNFWGKIKHFSKLWFPPAKELSFRYPVLEKAPILLPVCWVRRICYSLFFNRSAIKKQADNVKTLNSEEYKNIKKARSLATKNK
ncbi:MAG: nucleotidyltransferase family protein [Clostridia bacterium]|nr:nucleotidyltransferase family protein [Clostridia bacterium]